MKSEGSLSASILIIVGGVAISAAALLFGMQLLFQNDSLLGFMFQSIDLRERWLAERYAFWSRLVLGTSTLAAILWQVIARITPDRGAQGNQGMKGVWAFLSLLPLTATALFSFVPSDADFTSVSQSPIRLICAATFFVFGVLGYWISTALSSPAPYTFIPPLAFDLRRLFRL